MAESRTAVLAALLGNAALAALKGTAAVATGSAAMLAETLHSVADTGNQALLFLGMRLAERPPDRRHPFGHGRNIYVWKFRPLLGFSGTTSDGSKIIGLGQPSPRESHAWPPQCRRPARWCSRPGGPPARGRVSRAERTGVDDFGHLLEKAPC